MRVVIFSFLAAIALFFEYIPPFLRVSIPFDLPGFHYPLADYVYLSLRHGMFPAWDPSIYSGLPLAGNTQAQLFYPPAWLLYALSMGGSHLHFAALEIFVLLHVWLAFVLCYYWLRSRSLDPIACGLGAGVFAFSGYMMTQLQHLGLVTGFAWWPLAFWGIDEAHEARSARPLWKVVVASAAVFLSGYTPLWAVFAVCASAYAIARRSAARSVVVTWMALAASLALCAVQLLPAIEAGSLAVRQARYGTGIRDPMFYISYVIPNFWNFSLDVPVSTHPNLDYWYLGAAGLAGILVSPAATRRFICYPAVFMAAMTAMILTDPFGVLAKWLAAPTLISQLVRDWYFTAGLTAAAAMVAAAGIDHCVRLRPERSNVPVWVVNLAVVATAARCVFILMKWAPGATGFAHGWASARDTALDITIVALCLGLLSHVRDRARTLVVCTLFAFVLIEYKAFGTSKRFNADLGGAARDYAHGEVPGLDPELARQVRAHPEFRVVVDTGGPLPHSLRHAGLTTPQGFDPMLPGQYYSVVEQCCRFTSDREFQVDVLNPGVLRLFGVRYYISNEGAEYYARLMTPGGPFRLLEPSSDYYKVFELIGAQPSYGWEDSGDADGVAIRAWRADWREFSVHAGRDRMLRLSEQFYPGWVASIDGTEAPIQRCAGAFQCVPVPAGAHLVEFRFRSRSLRIGLFISVATMLLLCGWYKYGRWGRPARN